jgi:hypothetical protein
LETLREAVRAEQVAVDLRRTRGADAEAWCDAQRSRLPQGDPEQRLWSDVRRTLRWVKT